MLFYEIFCYYYNECVNLSIIIIIFIAINLFVEYNEDINIISGKPFIAEEDLIYSNKEKIKLFKEYVVCLKKKL